MSINYRVVQKMDLYQSDSKLCHYTLAVASPGFGVMGERKGWRGSGSQNLA